MTSSITKHVFRRDLEIIDVPGQSRYLKSTLRGLLGCNNFTPMLIVHDINNSFPSNEFKVYVELARVLSRQIIVILTKCDQVVGLMPALQQQGVTDSPANRDRSNCNSKIIANDGLASETGNEGQRAEETNTSRRSSANINNVVHQLKRKRH